METAMLFALVIISAITLLYTSCKAEDKRKFDNETKNKIMKTIVKRSYND